MATYLLVAVGGALGSVGRFWLGGLVADKFGAAFPWGTLAVNVTGSVLIGVLAAFAAPEGRLDSTARGFLTQFLMIGVCGGYTTFSSFSLQTLNLAQEGQWLYAGANAVLSLTLCLVAVWLGQLLAQVVNR